MAKKQTKGMNLVQKFNLQKNLKKYVVAIAVLVLLIIASALLLNSRKVAVVQDTTAGTTSTRDLAKSVVNTNNTNNSTTEEPKTKVPTTPTPTPTPAPAPAPTPTPVPFAIDSGIYASVNNSNPSIGCNATVQLTFNASITANGAGTATYYWERSDGATGPIRQLVFSAAGTLDVSTTWSLSSDNTPGSYTVDGWQKVIVTAPNTATSKASDAAFTLSVGC